MVAALALGPGLAAPLAQPACVRARPRRTRAFETTLMIDHNARTKASRMSTINKAYYSNKDKLIVYQFFYSALTLHTYLSAALQRRHLNLFFTILLRMILMRIKIKCQYVFLN